MKLVIAGSRNVKDIADAVGTINGFMENLSEDFKISEIVSGGAVGVDTIAENWAKKNGIPFKMFPADWDKLGKSAGHIRNNEMAKYGDMLLAIWDGKSKGTTGMVNRMMKLEKPVCVLTMGMF